MSQVFKWQAEPELGVERLEYLEWGYWADEGEHNGQFLPLLCTPIGALPNGMIHLPQHDGMILAWRFTFIQRRIAV